MSGHVVNTTASNLFGDMITSVHIGGKPGEQHNPYPSINAILDKLGIESSAIDPHWNHFHIYLKPPTLEQIGLGAHLLADAATASQLDLNAPTPLQRDAQGLLDYTQTLVEGEQLMFTMDVPTAPPQETPVVLAQAVAPSATTQTDYILKDCQETESTGDPKSAMRAVDPAGLLSNFMQNKYNRPVEFSEIKNITLLQSTQHGNLVVGTSTSGRTTYHYDPTPNYIGNDKAVFMAEFEGKRYKIVLELHVFIGVDENSSTCPEPTLIKVTQPKPTSGTNGYDLNSISVTFFDLAGAALGQTTGTTITLDTNAAGNGWFIDSTPWDNSEFLPTSNPNEWVAKVGSDAAGKMDMLSVLLHEYGHALGIEHSADGGDYMAATLTPGVRRLPSAEELALMQSLIAQQAALLQGTPATPDNTPSPFPTMPLGASFIGFLGFLRGSRYGGVSIAPDSSTLVTEYSAMANPQFSNATFSAADGQPSTAGWSTQGGVSVAGGAATLQEVSSSQSRLNQVFVVNPNDRYLTFTLSGAALADPLPNPLPQAGEGANVAAAGSSFGPHDAFEVALLDANRGGSLLGGDGLTRTDAFLNTRKGYAGGGPRRIAATLPQPAGGWHAACGRLRELRGECRWQPHLSRGPQRHCPFDRLRAGSGHRGQPQL